VRFIEEAGLERVLRELAARGFELIGPTVRDGAIVLDRIDGVGDLPRGVHEEQEGGQYRLVAAPEDPRLFAFAHGPNSAKGFLFPGRELLARADRVDGHLEVRSNDEPAPAYAFVGLRACDLHAVEIQDRVFLDGSGPDRRYAERRRAAFFLAVNCAEPGATCFCASMGTGPRCTGGFDLSMTEVPGGFVIEIGTERGREILDAAGSREASASEAHAAREVSARAATAMGRSLDTSELPGLLARGRESARWDVVADRCLACGNCTAVCPTCFCHDVVDGSDLLGDHATRTREWASCFSQEFSHIVGVDVRATTRARYRQWLTHKFGTWVAQFGTSGCVGCGRCITWCPVGIDVTEELAAIRLADETVEATA
jgi:sulfhydrogenase subunit beta (sulfur reductase)